MTRAKNKLPFFRKLWGFFCDFVSAAAPIVAIPLAALEWAIKTLKRNAETKIQPIRFGLTVSGTLDEIQNISKHPVHDGSLWLAERVRKSFETHEFKCGDILVTKNGHTCFVEKREERFKISFSQRIDEFDLKSQEPLSELVDLVGVDFETCDNRSWFDRCRGVDLPPDPRWSTGLQILKDVFDSSDEVLDYESLLK